MPNPQRIPRQHHPDTDPDHPDVYKKTDEEKQASAARFAARVAQAQAASDQRETRRQLAALARNVSAPPATK